MERDKRVAALERTLQRFNTSNPATFVVTIADETAPVITGTPSDMPNVSADNGECYASITWTAPTATDNCEVSSITGLDKDDIKTHSQSSSYKRKSSRIKKDATETKEERVFQQTGLGSKILNVILAYPFLASEIKNLERFEGFREPEVGLMIEVAKYFLSDPKLGISDLLSNIDPDSASFIGTLISTSPTIEEKNALAYLEDCLSLLISLLIIKFFCL